MLNLGLRRVAAVGLGLSLSLPSVAVARQVPSSVPGMRRYVAKQLRDGGPRAENVVEWRRIGLGTTEQGISLTVKDGDRLVERTFIVEKLERFSKRGPRNRRPTLASLVT